MNHLLLLAMLVLMPVSQNQGLPDAFNQLPPQVREQATIVVTGTYGKGRGACIFMPDGSRRWALEYWFLITKVYRGKVAGRSININSAMLPKNQYVSLKLEAGRDYLVLLRPSEKSMEVIKKGRYVPVWDALHDEEIIAIVELNDGVAFMPMQLVVGENGTQRSLDRSGGIKS